ncbi:LysE family translocator [Bacillus pseudomycoides]|uniref:Lysine transporter LysE n=1 Tax=Bacillus pseudomycoides TaxID=64104 RepID=A0A2B5HJ91_9BACI|nr:LysE family transporter [Bacillus pseudomycoides]PDY45050.1 lysine transporter LysE [Bacillus pseudomycoides]PEA83849.1 lysine transporter LysE [Bacillus pseudomycoides]PED69560.1 lysine transporter LysE [Bacillus pseudomycoides]PEI46786.1 lysine transporter LysE [Bacillus pseudomycoides]PEJ68140.1 lysine transporter LysE [Bacillus pseudomycoides]
MASEFLLKGLTIGFSIVAPVGPIGILCIRRTLENGRFVGFMSGLGAATADGLYSLIAGLSLTVITNYLINQQLWFQLIGGIFLGYFGVKTYKSKPSNTLTKSKNEQNIKAYASTFFLTITNPVTILSFIALFSGLGIANSDIDLMEKLILVLGVFLGSILWWLFLSIVVSLLKNRINAYSLIIINKTSGLILLLFSLRSFYDVLITTY